MTAIDTAAASRLPDSLPVVAIRGLTKSFGANQVLAGVDLEVRKGEVVSVKDHAAALHQLPREL